MGHEYWYLSRAAGFTAYLLLFGSVALGMMLSTRTAARARVQNLAFDLHRFLSILSLVFVVFHVYILLGDQYFNLNVWQLSLPFTSPYRTWATTTGVVSMYISMLVVASFYVRKYIGYRSWRVLHFLAFALFAGATLHGISAGTDTQQTWARILYAGCGFSVVAFLVYRIQHQFPKSESGRWMRVGAAAATMAAGLVLAFSTGIIGSASG